MGSIGPLSDEGLGELISWSFVTEDPNSDLRGDEVDAEVETLWRYHRTDSRPYRLGLLSGSSCLYVRNTEHLFSRMNDRTPNYTQVMLMLLDFLGRDPDNSFHVRELAEKAGVSIGAASITLRAMHEQGLIDLEEKGAMKFYSFNLLDPLARQWKVLFTIQRLKSLLHQLEPHAERIVLFGSCANGTDTKDSDIDLFIVARDTAPVKNALWRFERELGRHLSPIIVPPGGLSRIRREDQPLFESILQGRVLWPNL